LDSAKQQQASHKPTTTVLGRVTKIKLELGIDPTMPLVPAVREAYRLLLGIEPPPGSLTMQLEDLAAQLGWTDAGADTAAPGSPSGGNAGAGQEFFA